MQEESMKITPEQIKEIKRYPNSIYTIIKQEFLYHSNKIEGSTFTKENLALYLDKRIIEGSHKLDDVFETINSVDLFDFVIDTLGEPITKSLILEFHRMLKRNTLDAERGFSGCWKKIPNYISGSDVQVAQPYEVEWMIEDLLEWWNSSPKTFDHIVAFHVKFEKIHPFQDGNGRIGRFLMLKQCIENNVDLIAIDEKYESEYKMALKDAQLIDNKFEDYNVFRMNQKGLFDYENDLKNTLKALGYCERYEEIDKRTEGLFDK